MSVINDIIRELLEVCAYLYDNISAKFPEVTKAQALAPFIIFRGYATILTKPQAHGLATGSLTLSFSRSFILFHSLQSSDFFILS